MDKEITLTVTWTQSLGGRLLRLKLQQRKNDDCGKRKEDIAAKKKDEEVCFVDNTYNKYARFQLFMKLHQLAKTNCDVTGEKCVTNDDVGLAYTDSGKLTALKQHYVKLLREEFLWEKSILYTLNLVINALSQYRRLPQRSHIQNERWENSWDFGVAGDIGIRLVQYNCS